tara:strand:+ start:1931 stop:2176 length:246 start_codon:yes stop_codon:yes gene_type:complete
MFEAILAIAAALITFWLKRKIKRLEDEKAEYQEALAEIDLAIATGNQDRVNHRLDDVLRRLSDPKNNSNPRGQTNDADGSK